MQMLREVSEAQNLLDSCRTGIALYAQLGPSEANFAHEQIERRNALIRDVYHAFMAENPKRDPEIAMALGTATKI